METIVLIFGSLILAVSFINIIRQSVFLIGSDIFVIKDSLSRVEKSTYLPNVSVVIPMHNEGSLVERALCSIRDNTYLGNRIEVIVVDDGSVDDSVGLAKRFKDNNPKMNLKIVTQQNLGKAAALNNGMKNYAGGELLMCLDADSYLDSKAIEETVRVFQNPRVAATAANIKIIEEPTLLNLIQRFEYLVSYQMKRAETVFNVMYIVGGIGSCFRKEVLEQVGYYDSNTMTEDIDLTMKIIGAGKGYITSYAAHAVAYTEGVGSIKDLLRQRFRWKFGRAQTFVKHGRVFFSSNKRINKILGWIYLPFTVLAEFMFLFEPIFLLLLTYLTIRYQNLDIFLSAYLVVTFYVIRNVLSEEATLNNKEKIMMLIMSPLIYVLFYILSFVEYAASIKTLVRLGTVEQSIQYGDNRWTHVKRSIGI